MDPEILDDGGALSLAKLRIDGFVSLDAEEAGTITTKPFMLNGEDYIREVKDEVMFQCCFGLDFR